MSDWIFDPQLWDLRYLAPQGDLSDRFNKMMLTLDREKIVISFVGRVSRRKGAKQFFELVVNAPQNYLFIVAGKIDHDIGQNIKKSQFSNVHFLDYYVSDDELLEVYRISNYVWACYDISCDQSSGIFGRAVQLQKVPIVREGSYIESLAKFLKVKHVSLSIPNGRLTDSESASLFERLETSVACDTSAQNVAVEFMESLSVRQLKKSLDAAGSRL